MDGERARELLARERERIEKALDELSPDGAGDELSHLDQHPADEASDLYQREQDDGLRAALAAQLEAVARAEQRLAEGSYGRSVESGEPIPDARLEAMPWAERTAPEQQRYENAV